MEMTVGASSIIRNESGIRSSVSRFCVLLCLTGLAIEIYFELSFIHMYMCSHRYLSPTPASFLWHFESVVRDAKRT